MGFGKSAVVSANRRVSLISSKANAGVKNHRVRVSSAPPATDEAVLDEKDKRPDQVINSYLPGWARFESPSHRHSCHSRHLRFFQQIVSPTRLASFSDLAVSSAILIRIKTISGGNFRLLVQSRTLILSLSLLSVMGDTALV
jgi:hypothetical protein